MSETTNDRQRIETGKAAEELASQRAAVRQRVDEPPQPGDVFVFRQTAEFDYSVEWLVVERRPADGRLLVVPLDDYPFVGSRDVELMPAALGGVANQRGGADLEAWLDAADFELELRTSALSQMDLERVRRKRRDVQAGKVQPSLLEDDVDGDPEYQMWREELTGARAALPIRPERPAIPEQPDRRWRWGALAAAVLLAIAGWYWTTEQMRTELQRERERIARLESEGEALKDRLETTTREASRLEAANQELRDLKESVSRELEQQLSRVTELTEALKAEIQINLPTIALAGRDRTRGQHGEPYQLDLRPDVKRVALSLEVVDPEPYSRYRLRIVEKGSGEEIWSTDQLVKMGGRWLRLDLPADLFEEGEYELVIYGLGMGSPQLLEERYAMKVNR